MDTKGNWTNAAREVSDAANPATTLLPSPRPRAAKLTKEDER